jgi:hypothetical protein
MFMKNKEELAQAFDRLIQRFSKAEMYVDTTMDGLFIWKDGSAKIGKPSIELSVDGRKYRKNSVEEMVLLIDKLIKLKAFL